MAHNIRSESAFISVRQPAWHNLGQVLTYDVSAVDARNRIGSYEVRTESILTVSGLEVPDHLAVIRGPTKEEDSTRVFGLVKKNIQIISPIDLAEIWDQATGRFIETIGDLGHGEQTFITTKLPGIGVNGEDVDLFLLLDCDYLGKLTVRVVHIRVVCQNTLTMARNDSKEVYQIDLTGQPRHQLQIVLEDVPKRAEERAAALKETFTVMAETRITEEQHHHISRIALPIPYEPSPVGDPDLDEVRNRIYLERLYRVKEQRDAVDQVFQGSTSLSGEPTLWNSYNSVVEVVDWFRKGERGPSMQSLFRGAQAAAKERAWDESLKLVPA